MNIHHYQFIMNINSPLSIHHKHSPATMMQFILNTIQHHKCIMNIDFCNKNINELIPSENEKCRFCFIFISNYIW